jgi:hypothetical protein
MNTDRTASKEEAAQEDTLGNEARAVLARNATLDGATHRGWFLGHFLEDACGLRATSAVEVKWGIYSAGEERSSWGLSERATTSAFCSGDAFSSVFLGRSISSHARENISSGLLASRIAGKC